jgi:hypothetical protein
MSRYRRKRFSVGLEFFEFFSSKKFKNSKHDPAVSVFFLQKIQTFTTVPAVKISVGLFIFGFSGEWHALASLTIRPLTLPGLTSVRVLIPSEQRENEKMNELAVILF